MRGACVAQRKLQDKALARWQIGRRVDVTQRFGRLPDRVYREVQFEAVY